MQPVDKDHLYSVPELRKRWNVSADFVIDEIDEEPGVKKWVRQTKGRRRYITRRVPGDVLERIERRITND